MEPSLMSARDREVLRSFARRIDPADAGAHNNLGVLYFNKGMHEESVAALTRALELDARMTVAQRNLEIAYFTTGYYDRRVPQLRERLDAAPHDRAARRELARTYALLGQYASAAAEFGALVREDSGDAAAVLQLALAEHKRGNLERAAEWIARALELEPRNPQYHFHAGEISYHRGLNEDAVDRLRHAIALAADLADAHYLLGFVLGDMGRHDEARSAAQRAMQLNPALGRAQANLSLDQLDARTAAAAATARAQAGADREMEIAEEGHLAHFNLGLAFRQKGYFSEALREYRLALDRGEGRSLVLQAMAEVHLLQADGGAAAELYDRLVEADLLSPKLWNERGIALHQLGRLDEAVQSYERAIAVDPRYAIAHNNVGVAQWQCGRLDESIAAFRAALREHSGFVKARLNLALLLFKQKQLQLCLEAYRHVLQLVPEHATAWNGVGVVLAELRKFEDARNAFARAIEARPDHAESHYNLSFALSNLGDFEGALRETKRALELDPYYVPQKFELAIDLEFEDPDIRVSPDLGAERREEQLADFEFDAEALGALFAELAPSADAGPRVAPAALGSPYAAAVSLRLARQFDRALAEAHRALALGGDKREGLVLIGELFLELGAHGEAHERFRQARVLDEADISAAAGEARALLALGRGAEASAVAEWLAEQAPSDVDLLLLVARVRCESRGYLAALSALELARRLAPMRADVMRDMGDAARAMGDLARAEESYRYALSLDRDFAAVRLDLARLLMEREEHEAAERELLAALDTVPTYAEAAMALAALWCSRQRAREAVRLLAELLLREPYHFDALAGLGEALLRCTRLADARVAFERVLRFVPTHPAALYWSGMQLNDTHRYAEAIARWAVLIDAHPEHDYARQARLAARSAQDLQRIFAARERKGAA
ncbi:MAG: tetratricopeptide repeat protein [Gemmatimonadaceae bacterium]